MILCWNHKTIFKILDEAGINDTSQFADIKSIINIIKHVKEVDEETKNLTIDFITTSLFN